MNDYPGMCVGAGLDCETCTAGTATQLAGICRGLPGGKVGQIFVQIHPYPSCARMHSHFSTAYRRALSEARPRVAAAAA